MTPKPQRAERLPKAHDAAEPIELLSAAADFVEPSFDEEQWREQAAEERGTGGRQVLGTALTILAGALARLYCLVCRTDARGTAVIVAAACAVGRGCRRATRAAGTCLADVRPHPPQGSRAVHTVGRGDAQRNAFPGGLAGSAVAADPRQPLRTGHDLATSDEAWGRGDRQAWRDHARVRYQQRELMRHGEALDRAAEAARTDIAVLLEDLPRAEQTARAVADQLRAVGSEFDQQGRGLQPTSERACRPHARRRRACRARQRIGLRPGSPRSKRRARMPRRASTTPRRPIRDARCAARPHVHDAGPDPHRDRRSGSSCRRPGRSGVGRASARPERDAAESLATNIDHANSSSAA